MRIAIVPSESYAVAPKRNLRVLGFKPRKRRNQLGSELALYEIAIIAERTVIGLSQARAYDMFCSRVYTSFFETDMLKLLVLARRTSQIAVSDLLWIDVLKTLVVDIVAHNINHQDFR